MPFTAKSSLHRTYRLNRFFLFAPNIFDDFTKKLHCRCLKRLHIRKGYPKGTPFKKWHLLTPSPMSHIATFLAISFLPRHSLKSEKLWNNCDNFLVHLAADANHFK